MSHDLRPYEILPMPAPRDYDPSVAQPLFFYEHFVKPLIPDMIQMMDTGLHIDPEAVEELRTTIDTVLKSVSDRLEANQLIKDYQNSRLPDAQKKHAEKATQALRTIDYYLVPYKPGDMVHRTWIVNCWLKAQNRFKDFQEKWTVKDLKAYNVFLDDPFLKAILTKRKLKKHEFVNQVMVELAKHKLELWNRPRLDKAKKPVELEPYNPGSPKQNGEFFVLMKVEPLAWSKDTGEPSWGRDQLEIVQKNTTNPELLDVLQAMIDFSYSAIIKNNFLKAFDSFTIDGVLHGNIKLFGAKSFRPTSNNPNLLNAPSSKSIYAYPLKKCIIAPPKRVVYTADLAAGEDRWMANLSGDKNKQSIFLENLDGHSLNSCVYFEEEIAEIMGPVPKDHDMRMEYIREFYAHADGDDKVLKKIRFNSKAPTFKLAYGGYPDADKGGVITQEIFDNYHNVLYPGITRYREKYVLPITKQQGYIHLGLGCRMYSSKPDQAIRTLNNATVQFWSILVMIAINELNYRIREENLQHAMDVTSTIYDSIYLSVVKDSEIIAWLNENIIELMTVQWLEEETIRNEACGEIGLNWADLHRVNNHATPAEIADILEQL